ncbi:CAP domain-containing protein [Pararhodobacter sp. SW119]|uniref:CAP domain-containing protein n=1 Tax=Pararhodobacter sp. SW119 TaxID=2780075 RepID=UPI001ADFDF44|nr:CAP domain-containing protein [Pararhodobacter sp. SW119]
MTNPLLPVVSVALAALAACAPTTGGMRLGPDGRPVPTVYRIGAGDGPRVQARMRDGINAARARRGLRPVQLNDRLSSAAAAHARDMSRQGRPWHFGSDGSSPIDRANRAGYGGRFLGELISETFETELETLTAWLEARETRGLLLDPQMNEIGFAWYQETNGKLWWALTTGAASTPMAGL